ncbi:TPA: SAM-dependent DNA methyltransferase [Klebsiella pneumoniae]|uniref:Eco57I restriction-modification methylase domain-containing protein n=1 Tax=Klebsiella pneumoniae TaxID=573 RepID=UPI0022442370|nr:N-6 DNA methylase [Klebsiella pneumoniae]MCW8294025.1 SAM-dependent DNA methyltransferase [Klebsiella pneumoniae]HCI4291545.1 SAM-dependent DNA methyltransferase [Klebsiella pneumoniae]
MTKLVLSSTQSQFDADMFETKDVQVLTSVSSGDPKSDARKPRTKAEALGQVFTSQELANRMVRGLGIPEHGTNQRLLDPCVGPATFPKAIDNLISKDCKLEINAIDLDLEMVHLTEDWSINSNRQLNIRNADYLEYMVEGHYDFAILNPPYVRQEWITKKKYYKSLFKENYGVDVPGTANLYVYFIVKVIAELKLGGKMACIVYDSWQSTKFGQWLKQYINENCSWAKVENIASLPFDGRLIDATIIYAEKGHSHGDLFESNKDSLLNGIDGLNVISNLFDTRRGLRLKQSSFFMTDIANAEREGASAFVKKVALIPGFIVPDNHPEAAILITKRDDNSKAIKTLEHRLMQALASPKNNISILTWKKERPDTWALHRNSHWAPLLFNYYLRKRPRHIYNPNRIYSDNFYGVTPLSNLPVMAWLAALNSTLSSIGILEQARNQGAGLAKLQLFEYRVASVIDLTIWSVNDIKKLSLLGQELINSREISSKIISKIDELVFSVLADERLKINSINEIYLEVERNARRPKN